MPEPLSCFLAILGYGALHSGLASRTAKAAARKYFGPAADRYYRLIYNTVALVTLIPLLAVLGRNIGPVAFAVPMPWGAVVAVGLVAAILLFGVSFLQSDPLYFIGLRQLGNPDADSRLITTGAYRLVRHPIYTVAMLVLWCLPIQTTGLLAFNLGATLYFLAGSELEERRLIEAFGGDYLRYRARVARFIPYIF
jgi:protein-S-isoprenylcysteine O-methyltransferase Ste14